jgi:hypothetical protein
MIRLAMMELRGSDGAFKRFLTSAEVHACLDDIRNNTPERAMLVALASVPDAVMGDTLTEHVSVFTDEWVVTEMPKPKARETCGEGCTDAGCDPAEHGGEPAGYGLGDYARREK